MQKTPQVKEIERKVDEFLNDQGLSHNAQEVENRLEQILQMLEASRNTQNSLYSWEPAHGKGPIRGIKNFILKRIKNIVVNVLEKYIMRQQKFNELTYQALLELQKEITELKQPVPDESASKKSFDIKSIFKKN